MMKYTSSAAGGGAPGRDAGTVPGIMIAAGELTAFPRLFTKQFLPAGEMITEIAAGKVIPGNTKEYPTIGFIKTGEHGITTDTGKETNRGMSRAYRQEKIIEIGRLNTARSILRAELKAQSTAGDVRQNINGLHKKWLYPLYGYSHSYIQRGADNEKRQRRIKVIFFDNYGHHHRRYFSLV
jgi:hypothetical protein